MCIIQYLPVVSCIADFSSFVRSRHYCYNTLLCRMLNQRPLKDRVLRSASTSSRPSQSTLPARPVEYKSWDEKVLQRACEAVQKDRATAQKHGATMNPRMTVRRAAEAY